MGADGAWCTCGMVVVLLGAREPGEIPAGTVVVVPAPCPPEDAGDPVAGLTRTAVFDDARFAGRFADGAAPVWCPRW